jgi:hypothetical protein
MRESGRTTEEDFIRLSADYQQFKRLVEKVSESRSLALKKMEFLHGAEVLEQELDYLSYLLVRVRVALALKTLEEVANESR